MSTSTPTFPLVATGVPSLDDLLGGGLPLGSILLVLAPDAHSAWSRLIERYWIAQGLVLGHRIAVAGELAAAKDLVQGCMWVDEKAEGAPAEEEGESEGEGLAEEQTNRTKIAWRYEKMKKYRTTVTGKFDSQVRKMLILRFITAHPYFHDPSAIVEPFT
jgi:elongator complex protein 4